MLNNPCSAWSEPTPKADPTCNCICHTQPGIVHMMACCHTPDGSEIISDEKIDSVHANAQFGDRPKREVVNENLLRVKQGYHIGYTARTILLEHKLVAESRKNFKKLYLTQIGNEYLAMVTP